MEETVTELYLWRTPDREVFTVGSINHPNKKYPPAYTVLFNINLIDIYEVFGEQFGDRVRDLDPKEDLKFELIARIGEQTD
jgi:hypothetical protein